jgi:hypothetical protein
MGLTIGVIGASGGLGASTLVATLAVRGHAVLDRCSLSVGVDLDPRGGLETTMCLEHLDGRRWPDVEAADWSADPAGLVSVTALPGDDHVHVLGGAGTCPLPWRLVDDVLEALEAAADLVVVDCGHRPAPPLLSRLDLLVVLGRTSPRGAADLAALGDAVPLSRTSAVLVTRAVGRERHGHVLARELRLPLLAHLPDDSVVLRHERDGVPPGGLRSAVDVIADEIITIAQSAGPAARLTDPGTGTPAWSA